MNTQTYKEKIAWHEITKRPLTDDERAKLEEIGVQADEMPRYKFDCLMPCNGAEILVATNNGVMTDECYIPLNLSGDEPALRELEGFDNVIAWANMPQYKGGWVPCR